MDFSIDSLAALGPSGTPKKRVGGMGAYPWGLGKTSHSEKSIVEHLGKHHFGKIAQTGAVRKDNFLRDKVSQGRPHPSRLSVKLLRSDPVNSKCQLER